MYVAMLLMAGQTAGPFGPKLSEVTAGTPGMVFWSSDIFLVSSFCHSLYLFIPVNHDLAKQVEIFGWFLYPCVCIFLIERSSNY
jgi:hypothetical protein